jgi:hypothetical protein
MVSFLVNNRYYLEYSIVVFYDCKFVKGGRERCSSRTRPGVFTPGVAFRVTNLSFWSLVSSVVAGSGAIPEDDTSSFLKKQPEKSWFIIIGVRHVTGRSATESQSRCRVWLYIP